MIEAPSKPQSTTKSPVDDALRAATLPEPRGQADPPEVAGKPWTPGEWRHPQPLLDCAPGLGTTLSTSRNYGCLTFTLGSLNGDGEQRRI